MKKAILATKVGMTQIFNEDGALVPVTVLQAGPCVVTQVKTMDNDGYSAVQVGFTDKREKLVSKPVKGHFDKAGVSYKRYVREFRFENAEEYNVKDEIKADVFAAGENVDIVVGNSLPIMNIPVGTMIHNIELRPGKGGELARSAGASAQILGREDDYVMIRLSSGEQRKVLGTCMATVGVVGNEDSSLVKVGKAGRTRHMGIRPTVRGSVMNPNDHPHGGGEGRAPVGRKAPMTPWGKPALGLKTRKKKQSDKFIVRRRNGK